MPIVLIFFFVRVDLLNLDRDYCGHILFPVWGSFWIFFSHIEQLGSVRTERELEIFSGSPFVFTIDLRRLRICGFHPTMSWMYATGMQHPVQGSVQRASRIWIFEGCSHWTCDRTRERSLSFLNSKCNVHIRTY